MHKLPYSKRGTGKRSNLIRMRLAKGMSQEAVAKKLGCSRELYSQIENGSRDGSTLDMSAKLESFFGIEAGYLMAVCPFEEVFTNTFTEEVFTNTFNEDM